MKIKGRKKKRKREIITYFNLLFNYILHNGEKKRWNMQCIRVNYAQFQNYNMEKLDFLPSLHSSVCTVIHILIFSFKGVSLMAAFQFFQERQMRTRWNGNIMGILLCQNRSNSISTHG